MHRPKTSPEQGLLYAMKYSIIKPFLSHDCAWLYYTPVCVSSSSLDLHKQFGII